LGWKVNPQNARVQLIESDHENKQVAALSVHAFKIFDNNELNYRIRRIEDQQELSNHLDNTKRGPEVLWYERMRQVWGKLVYAYFFLINIILKGFGKIFGVTILRSSQDPR
jgi:hypothetical protein